MKKGERGEGGGGKGRRDFVDFLFMYGLKNPVWFILKFKQIGLRLGFPVLGFVALLGFMLLLSLACRRKADVS